MSAWLPRADLPWSRRIAATLFMLPWAWAAWNGVGHGGPIGRSGWVFLAYLVVAALLLHVAHPVAQATARAVLWATVLAGVPYLHSLEGWGLRQFLDKDFGVFAAGGALLALGGVRRGSGHPRRNLVPAAFGRTLSASLVGALIQVVVLSLVALADGAMGHPRRVIFDVALTAAVGLGVAGTSRLRAWGPLLVWLTTAAFAGLVALDLCRTRVAGVMVVQLERALPGMSSGLLALSVAQLVVMLPLVAVIVRGSSGAR